MSGGSLGHLYITVRDAAADIRSRRRSPLYQAFADHLDLVATALHDVEWVLSCDYAEGDADEIMRKALTPGAEMDAALRQAKTVRKELDDCIARASRSGVGEPTDD